MRGEAEPSPTIGLVATLSVVLIGALGGIMLSLQPLLLGRLAMEGAIQGEGIGQLAMAATAGLAGISLLAHTCVGSRAARSCSWPYAMP